MNKKIEKLRNEGTGAFIFSEENRHKNWFTQEKKALEKKDDAHDAID